MGLRACLRPWGSICIASAAGTGNSCILLLMLFAGASRMAPAPWGISMTALPACAKCGRLVLMAAQCPLKDCPAWGRGIYGPMNPAYLHAVKDRNGESNG